MFYDKVNEFSDKLLSPDREAINNLASVKFKGENFGSK